MTIWSDDAIVYAVVPGRPRLTRYVRRENAVLSGLGTWKLSALKSNAKDIYRLM